MDASTFTKTEGVWGNSNCCFRFWHFSIGQVLRSFTVQRCKMGWLNLGQLNCSAV